MISSVGQIVLKGNFSLRLNHKLDIKMRTFIFVVVLGLLALVHSTPVPAVTQIPSKAEKEDKPQEPEPQTPPDNFITRGGGLDEGSSFNKESATTASPGSSTADDESDSNAFTSTTASPGSSTADDESDSNEDTTTTASPGSSTANDESGSNAYLTTTASPGSSTADDESGSNTFTSTTASPGSSTADDESGSNAFTSTTASPGSSTADDESGSNEDTTTTASPGSSRADDESGSNAYLTTTASPGSSTTDDESGSNAFTSTAASPGSSTADDESGSNAYLTTTASPGSSTTDDESGSNAYTSTAASPGSSTADDESGYNAYLTTTASPGSSTTDDESGSNSFTSTAASTSSSTADDESDSNEYTTTTASPGSSTAEGEKVQTPPNNSITSGDGSGEGSAFNAKSTATESDASMQRGREIIHNLDKPQEKWLIPTEPQDKGHSQTAVDHITSGDGSGEGSAFTTKSTTTASEAVVQRGRGIIHSLAHKPQENKFIPPEPQNKGHSTPGWIIIVGFIVGVAALVLICVAIATRDKWNGPRPSRASQSEPNSSNQQRELEMETFLHQEQPRENGKAADYSVIPLDDLPEKHSSC